MKMAIVGCEASGKTVFMCALADYYGLDAAKNPQRLRLTPENASANSFERYQFHQMRRLKRWPTATPPERTIEMRWSLRREAKPLAEIDMLEFGGEAYRAAFRDDSPDAVQDKSAQELLTYLSGADFFVVLVSIKSLLSQEDNSGEQDFERATEAIWVTRGILRFIRKKRPGAGIVIGLTQADRYRTEIDDAGGPRQLFAQHWPTVAAAAENLPVVEVASVSKTDDKGNPAEGYHTHGILPVMKAFAKHCFGDENALENGPKRLLLRTEFRRRVMIGALAAITVSALVVGGIRTAHVLENAHSCPYCSDAAPQPPTLFISIPVTNTVEKIVEKVVTNKVERFVERPVTNTVEKVVERPVTNTVEKIVEKVVERPVTNTVEKVVEKIVERPVTNTVEKVVTNVVVRAAADSSGSKPPAAGSVAPKDVSPADPARQSQLPPGYRMWTDYNGHKITAKWIATSADGNTITLLTRSNRRMDAILWKFSAEDQAYIKAETASHAKLGETMTDGVWTRSPTPLKD